MGPQKFTVEEYTLLYNTSIQKFLAYSIVGAATFVGFVQLSIELHASGLSPVDHLELLFVILAVFVAILAATVAAARQYFFAGACHGSQVLQLRGLESQLVQDAPRSFALFIGTFHGFDWNSARPYRTNHLIVVVGLISLVLVLVLIFALS
ncbi:MAG TPA: hypothetical protein VKT21_05580 [Thermoplasmata archaeon]|nr:hypothetical protein [Thermoplasmata archaeon]